MRAGAPRCRAARLRLGQPEGGDDPGRARSPSPTRRAAQSFAGSGAELDRGDRDRLLDVRGEVVAEDEDRVAPLVGEVERELGQLDRLGDVDRGEHDVPVVAVAAAAGGLEVVALPAGHVEDDERQLGEA